MADPPPKTKKKPALDIEVAPEERDFTVTASGTFREGDLQINRDGIVIAGRSEASASSSTGSEHEDEVPLVGLKLDEIQLLEVIGQGASGAVHRARHKPSGRMLAIKIVPLNVVEEKVRKQILQELKTHHEAQSKHIVLFHDAFYSEGNIYIALEYMDGYSLLEVVKAVGTLPEVIIAKIATQVLKGLAYLHKDKHLIHRDIKPSNLLLNSRGQVKIADFGVCGQLASSLSTEKCASWVGTVCYMSPERISGSPYGYDTDIWSVGLTALELAQGRFPYPPPGETIRALGFWELMEYIVTRPPPVLPADKFSREFCDFVSACLKKDLSERPTASELLVHPFITKYAFEDIDMADWVRRAIARVKAKMHPGRGARGR
eukprot:tig00020830_g14449.t1